jgi:hypothetical protein
MFLMQKNFGLLNRLAIFIAMGNLLRELDLAGSLMKWRK